MTDIFVNQGDNLGSIETLEFVPIDDVASIPEAVDQVISSSITFNPYKRFFTMECTLQTVGYQEPEELTDNGPMYKKRLVGFIPKDTKELNAQFSEMENYRYIVRYKDTNGQYKIAGSKEEPLEFKADLDTTTDVFGRAGHAVVFFADSSHKAYTYTA